MKFEIIAELLLILCSNGIRFYAIKRYMDFLFPRRNANGKIIGYCMLSGVFLPLLSVWYLSPSLNIVANIGALLLLTFAYQVKLTKKLLITFVIYAINIFVEVIIVQLLVGYEPGQPVKSGYHFITSLVILIPTAFGRNLKNKRKSQFVYEGNHFGNDSSG